jgi:hypothetical protein
MGYILRGNNPHFSIGCKATSVKTYGEIIVIPSSASADAATVLAPSIQLDVVWVIDAIVKIQLGLFSCRII